MAEKVPPMATNEKQTSTTEQNFSSIILELEKITQLQIELKNKLEELIKKTEITLNQDINKNILDGLYPQS